MAWIQIHFRSASTKMPVELQALIPQYSPGGGRGAVSHNGPYPTLYLLHGLGGSGTEWLRNTSLERYLHQRPMAVILPDANNSFWANMQTGQDYFNFITEELPAACEAWFPLSKKREDRFIGGISMGGFGALNAALNRPDIFSKAACLSSVTDLAPFYERDLTVKLDWVFGPRDEWRKSVNNPYVAAEKLASSSAPKPDFFMSCGRQDGLFEGGAALRDHLTKCNIPVVWHEIDGVHNWAYGDAAIQSALDWIGVEKEG